MKKISGRQGRTKTNLSGAMAYESFVPSRLQDVLPIAVDGETTRILSACSRKVGEVEGMSRFVPNADMYMTMYVRKEALLSSQIEGTQCTLDDILDPNASGSLNADVADVINYVHASNFAVDEMRRLPLSQRLLREVHRELLSGVRGQDKEPGHLRESQNWIGAGGSTIATARFVPPNVDDMRDALSELEQFINYENEIDPIVKAALVHYQFETIHPFLDGNGRLGRLLITLSLMNDGVLTQPILYPSYQLKLQRDEYYRRLSAVREEGDYEGWVKFFCESLLTSATDATVSMMSLVELQRDSEKLVADTLGKGRQNGMDLLRLLYAHPIVSISFIAEHLEVSRSTASQLVNRFCALGILEQKDGQKRYRTFSYERYLEILRLGVNPLE